MTPIKWCHGITFKDPKVQAEFLKSPVLLRIIARDFALWSLEKGIIPVMTRVLEKIDGSSGVHEDGRACDFRDEHDGIRLYTDSQITEVVQYLNQKYVRNDDKPTALWHSFCGGPHHIHLQVHLLVKVYTG